MRLNEQSIKALKAPEKGCYLMRDEDQRGFALRVTANDARAFVLAYCIDGRERRVNIGRWPDWSTTAARERAKELRRMIDKGEDPLEQKRIRRAVPTIAEMAAEYIERHTTKIKSGKILREYINRDVLPKWGDRKASDITKRDVIELVERKAADTPIAGNMLLGVINGLFNWAIEAEVFKDGRNPAYKVKRPAAKLSRDRWLTEEEIRQFWTKLDTAAMAPESRTALKLILITAQRSGEVLSAEWSELDLETAWWRIPAEKAKNKLQHSVPLSSLGLEEIATLKPGRWLIPSSIGSGHMTVAGLSNAVSVNQKHFGLPRFTPHDLRRTAATQMTKAGVPQAIVGKLLNHVEKGVTRVYDRHGYDPEKKAALEKWARELRRILGTPAKAKVVELIG